MSFSRLSLLHLSACVVLSAGWTSCLCHLSGPAASFSWPFARPWRLRLCPAVPTHLFLLCPGMLATILTLVLESNTMGTSIAGPRMNHNRRRPKPLDMFCSACSTAKGVLRVGVARAGSLASGSCRPATLASGKPHVYVFEPSCESASITALMTAGWRLWRPTPLCPSRLVVGGGVSFRSIISSVSHGRGDEVVNHRAGHQVAVIVIDGLLVEGLPYPLRNAAVQLAVHDSRVDTARSRPPPRTWEVTILSRVPLHPSDVVRTAVKLGGSKT